MEVNRKAHPDCVYASNPFHECASACLERIAQGNGRKHTKKQASKILSISGSFGKKKKEPEPPSPLASRPYQNGSLAKTNSPFRDHRPIPPPNSVKKKTDPVENKSFSSSSSGELSTDLCTRDDHKQEHFSQTVPLSPNNMVDHSKAETPKATKLEHSEKNNAAGEVRSFSFLSPPRSHDNDEETNNDDDENNDADNGEEIEVESVISESCVSVGKYRVRPSVSSVLQSIIDKHGDIAANCRLESASMLARYLECLCSLVQELKSTPVGQLTKVKVKEMMAVLKDVESVNIDVGWLRSVLEEFARTQEADAEKERYEGLVGSARGELEALEADLVQREKELAETRARVEETRARLDELQMERSRLDEIGVKVEKFRGKSFIDELL